MVFVFISFFKINNAQVAVKMTVPVDEDAAHRKFYYLDFAVLCLSLVVKWVLIVATNVWLYFDDANGFDLRCF